MTPSRARRISGGAVPPNASTRDAVDDMLRQACHGHAHLGATVAIAYGYRIRAYRLAVDRDAKRCTGFVLAPVAPPDGALLVIDDFEAALELGAGKLGPSRTTVC